VSLLLIFTSAHGNQCSAGTKKISTSIPLTIFISDSLSKYFLNVSIRCWYGIPQEEHQKFEDFAKQKFPEASKECKEFLRHKTYLVYPLLAHNNDITVHKCIQSPGEFVVTKCAGYHAGFNMGFNCAEAVNFALKNWIDYGKQTGYCQCSSDNVKIDLKNFMQNLNGRMTAKSKTSKRDQKKSRKQVVNEEILCEDLTKKKRKRSEIKKKEKGGNSNSLPLGKMLNKQIDHKMNDEIMEKNTTKIKGESHDDWVCCDNCNKWRKIPKGDFINNILGFNYDVNEYQHGFLCSFVKNLTCESTEENWRANYTTLKRKYYKHKKISKTGLNDYYNRMKNSIVIFY
jgi:hypothetical protein